MDAFFTTAGVVGVLLGLAPLASRLLRERIEHRNAKRDRVAKLTIRLGSVELSAELDRSNPESALKLVDRLDETAKAVRAEHLQGAQ
jgi:hypothetical protein